MEYRQIGDEFCNEINNILASNKINASFLTGGGYAYDSIKYKNNTRKGDFDFMIVYDDYNTAEDIINKLKNTNFNYEDTYLKLDLNLLKSNKIDIIRLSGNYKGIKSTINLVPISLVKKICDLESDVIIKKISHNRNTSLFFAYGSDNSRITVNFISPSFITEDMEDHYIHLDFSNIVKNDNIYFGILSDSILKGFNKNYDKLNIMELRDVYLDNIHDFFKKNKIDSSLYINLYANNSYFPEYLKQSLIDEFETRGKIVGNRTSKSCNEPIIFTADFASDFRKDSFNFVNNKEYNMSFDNYINKMQNTEYDRQYLLDAVGKFFGYILSSENGTDICNDVDIISKIDVYGTNDLFFKDVCKYDHKSIVDSFMRCLLKNKENYNSELINNLLIISAKFLAILSFKELDQILDFYNIKYLVSSQLDNDRMKLDNLLNFNSFNEFGTYHNYTSKVMPSYTNKECEFLNSKFEEKKDSLILDIMCGYGRIANVLKNMGYKNIYGIDGENYNFLNVSKDFTFINDDYLKHDFTNFFDFAYSLYNCYDSNDYLYSILMKTHSILNNEGLFVIDCFNKDWRDSVDSKFFKVLYDANNYKLIIKRDYDSSTGKEITWYELYYNDKKIKEFSYSQKFFSVNDIYVVLDKDKWNIDVLNSLDLHSRNNAQKHILVLRKK